MYILANNPLAFLETIILRQWPINFDTMSWLFVRYVFACKFLALFVAIVFIFYKFTGLHCASWAPVRLYHVMGADHRDSPVCMKPVRLLWHFADER